MSRKIRTDLATQAVYNVVVMSLVQRAFSVMTAASVTAKTTLMVTNVMRVWMDILAYPTLHVKVKNQTLRFLNYQTQNC